MTELADGSRSCPPPTEGYLPCCWQAGNIIAQRCAATGIDTAECERLTSEARQNFVDAGISGHLTVPGQQVTDWLNCGQCEDCFAEPMDHRPMTTGQYALALSNFDDPEQPLRFRFGFIGASDNHGGSPGTGYKEVNRQRFVDGLMLANEGMAKRMMRDTRDPVPVSIPLSEQQDVGLNMQRNMERQSSFWMTGGLVATHSAGRNREAIWASLKNREVYATSGDRILLWFDEVSQHNQPAPMGSEISREQAPKFRVTAVGAFEQKPGCPDYAKEALRAQRLDALCAGECFNPGEQRKLIERIEIVRIRPQIHPAEDPGQLIDDPWLSFDCQADPMGCEVEITDPSFLSAGRETLYYARAIQQESLAINGGGLRCETDASGQCIRVNPCYGDYRTSLADDCLAPLGERAWSSPIFVRPAE